MMNKLQHDDFQQKAVRNTSDLAKKAFTAFQVRSDTKHVAQVFAHKPLLFSLSLARARS
jgi:uncharacterized protein GlcG (DUF336 family)